MIKSLLAGLTLSSAIATTSAFAADPIQVSDAWVRAAPPGASVMAGYFEISNNGMDWVTLTGANSPQFTSIEIHQSYMEGGMMQMKSAAPLVIDGHQTIRFEPGSYHLMMMKPTKTLKPGDTVHVSLEFEQHNPVMIEMPVKKMAGEEGMMMNMNHDGGHHH